MSNIIRAYPVRKNTTGSIASFARPVEDEYADLYYSASNLAGSIIEPPYSPATLYHLVENNHLLPVCIGAYEVNIDGTGWSVQTDSGEAGRDTPESLRLYNFFDEPYPNQSFVSQRRLLRWDLEVTGNAYLEVMRNGDSEIVCVRPIPSVSMRITRLGDPITMDFQITRNGETKTIQVREAMRLFVQKSGTALTYFKPFGVSMDVSASTGEWREKGELPITDRANEIIHFKAIERPGCPYGVPRWISQAPSVVGSRQAEELNLDFFDAGGIPPAIIFFNGGALAPQTREYLEAMLGQKTRDSLRALVCEVHSTSGTLTESGKVSVQVERFGAESQKDSMFHDYTAACSSRIKGAFRLPPIFLGESNDYSYATAYTSYTVAEAQVFAPERAEFDEIINHTLVREMVGYEGKYRFVSKPLSVSDSATKLQAIQIAAEIAKPEDKLAALNEVGGLRMTMNDASPISPIHDEPLSYAPPDDDLPTDEPELLGDNEPSAQDATPTPSPVHKQALPEVTPWLKGLATEYFNLAAIRSPTDHEKWRRKYVCTQVNRLDKARRQTFDRYLSFLMFGDFAGSHGANELCGCALSSLNHSHDA